MGQPQKYMSYQQPAVETAYNQDIIIPKAKLAPSMSLYNKMDTANGGMWNDAQTSAFLQDGGFDYEAGQFDANSGGMSAQDTLAIKQGNLADMQAANIGKVGMMDYANLGLSAFNAYGQHQANKTNKRAVDANIENMRANRAARTAFTSGTSKAFS